MNNEPTLAQAMIGLAASSIARAENAPAEEQATLVQKLLELLVLTKDLTPEQAGEAYYEEASREFGPVDLIHGSTTTRVEFDGTVTHFVDESTL